MDFLNDLAEWTGGLRASATKPVYQMRMDLEREMKRREIGEAFDKVVGLRQQLQDQGEAFGDEQKLRLFQAMGQAGIDPEKMASTNLEQLREQAFAKAMTGIDNPYALGNLANKLDVAPTKHVGGVTYNRFDPTTESILHMTEAVRADGRKKKAEAEKAEITTEVIAEFLRDEENSPILKVDAANDKPVAKHNQAVLIDANGNKRHFDQILQPDGSWAYTPAADQSGNELRVPATQGDTSLAKNMALMADKLAISDAEALKILTNTRQKSSGQLYEEAIKMAANSNATLFGEDTEKVKEIADGLFRMMRPGEPMPYEMVEKVNQGETVAKQSAPSLKTPSEQVVKSAREAISRGADPQAIVKRLQDNGYSTEGIL